MRISIIARDIIAIWKAIPELFWSAFDDWVEKNRGDDDDN